MRPPISSSFSPASQKVAQFQPQLSTQNSAQKDSSETLINSLSKYVSEPSRYLHTSLTDGEISELCLQIPSMKQADLAVLKTRIDAENRTYPNAKNDNPKMLKVEK